MWILLLSSVLCILTASSQVVYKDNVVDAHSDDFANSLGYLHRRLNRKPVWTYGDVPRFASWATSTRNLDSDKRNNGIQDSLQHNHPTLSQRNKELVQPVTLTGQSNVEDNLVIDRRSPVYHWLSRLDPQALEIHREFLERG
ncbi:hypothetical protein EG68_05645 [Paragonimus skrjabini miyazakii]|uniref:Uncharacterized protein n=1 Tax=Paragonimus skrjabini miyazakii TaxID=59628 RepID=A0A8S9YR97_9TREM|nr:hypothetical protein EG68_05645 [Paragonimus skrjabini miyazakii]